jgi:hypothetical protein
MADWISVKDRLPCKPGGLSEPVMVAAQEFGCSWQLFIAKCWISIMEPFFPKWYLDAAFYNIEEPRQVGPQVHYWMPIPSIPVWSD